MSRKKAEPITPGIGVGKHDKENTALFSDPELNRLYKKKHKADEFQPMFDEEPDEADDHLKQTFSDYDEFN